MATVTPAIKLLSGTICTVLFEMCIGHVLEVFKINKQTNNHMSYSEIYTKLTARKGLIGIWDGFIPWGLLMASCKGAAFSYGQAWVEYIFLNSFLISIFSRGTLIIFSSGFGGAIQGIIMSPLLLLKTRVITDERFREITGGVFETIKKSFIIGYEVISQEGISGLCKGMSVFSFKRFCDWITRYFFVEMLFWIFEPYLINKFGVNRDNIIVLTIIGLIGGTLSAISTVFLDVLVALLQDTKAKDKDSKNVGINWSKLHYGLGLRIWHVALTVVLMKNIVPYLAQIIANRLSGNYYYSSQIKIDKEL